MGVQHMGVQHMGVHMGVQHMGVQHMGGVHLAVHPGVTAATGICRRWRGVPTAWRAITANRSSTA